MGNGIKAKAIGNDIMLGRGIIGLWCPIKFNEVLDTRGYTNFLGKDK